MKALKLGVLSVLTIEVANALGGHHGHGHGHVPMPWDIDYFHEAVMQEKPLADKDRRALHWNLESYFDRNGGFEFGPGHIWDQSHRG